MTTYMPYSESIVSLQNAKLMFTAPTATHRLRVLDDVSLNVYSGEFVTIIGPSGCGKSTLLRVLAGLLQPDSGLCRWQDGIFEDRATQMAMNFQTPVLLPWLSVEENALLPFHVKKTAHNLTGEEMESRLKNLLELTNLLHFRRAFPYELSGGMQMRAALIRTLIVKPKLIFMDEPFAAIDELTRHDLGREFRNIAKTTNAATVFVTHSIQEAAFLSDRIIIMSPRPSRIVEEITVPFDQDEPRTEKLKRDRRFLDLCDQLRGVIAHG